MGQLDDPVFLGVVARSVAWSVVCFAAIHIGSIWAIHRLLDIHGPVAWAADIFASVGASLLAFWLFLPVAAIIGTFYFDRIALAVERRFFPWLPPARGASFAEQLIDGLALGCRVLALNVAALVVTLLLAGVGLGFVLGWLVSAYAIGRGLFVAVSMRRMSREMAESLYHARRGNVLFVGAVLAAASYVPFANLLLPVIGTAAMIHLLDNAISAVNAAGSPSDMVNTKTY